MKRKHRGWLGQLDVHATNEIYGRVMDAIHFQREWSSFRHETAVRTHTLLYILSGIRVYFQETAKAIVLTHGPDGLDDKKARETFIPLEALDLRAVPVLHGEALIDRVSPGGLAEQMVLKSWVAEIFDLWESRYRTSLKMGMGDRRNAIRPRHQVLGDLRLIRNNLLHSGADQAREDGAGACEILNWFAAGEPMLLSFDHVLDFLNQMDWLVDQPDIVSEAPLLKTNFWQLRERIAGAPDVSQPRLVSVRPIVGEDGDPEFFRYGAGVAFSDGVFGRLAMGNPFHEASDENDRLWNRLTASRDGLSIVLPGSDICVPAVSMYETCLSGSSKVRGPGPWSRPFQIAQ